MHKQKPKHVNHNYCNTYPKLIIETSRGLHGVKALMIIVSLPPFLEGGDTVQNLLLIVPNHTMISLAILGGGLEGLTIRF